jgi:circadian clock protein KaiA
LLSICIFCSSKLFDSISPYLGESDDNRNLANQVAANQVAASQAAASQAAASQESLPEHALAETQAVSQAVSAVETRYRYKWFDSVDLLLQHIQQQIQESGHVDCLVLQATPDLQVLLNRLQQQALLLPIVALGLSDASELTYHAAVTALSESQISQIGLAIDQAISQFIQLQPPVGSAITDVTLKRSLTVQQLRLAEKLKERLDYLGVFYKRNPQHFLRHMNPPQKADLLRQLRQAYRDIILIYFDDDAQIYDLIDQFVNEAFFADVPISQIVQIHMELMDEFSKQLKLEGRSDEMLLDYRLTLIDTLAHLCEMYRRSIPRES